MNDKIADHSERDVAIYALHLDLHKSTDIARRFGLSATTVREIIRKQKMREREAEAARTQTIIVQPVEPAFSWSDGMVNGGHLCGVASSPYSEVSPPPPPVEGWPAAQRRAYWIGMANHNRHMG